VNTVNLLTAVLNDPDDDAARLVYADALVLANDPRGEYIQLAIAYERASVEKRTAMRGRLDALLARHRAHWTQGAGGANAHFRRGFVEGLEGSPAELARALPRLAQREPIVELAVDARASDASYIVDDLALVPALSVVRRLDVRALRETRLLQSPHFTALREVRLTDALETFASGLLTSPAAAELRALGIDFADPPSERFPNQLALWPRLARLESLRLEGVQLGRAGARLLATSPARALVELTLRNCALGDEAILELAVSPLLATVRRLDLANNRISDEGSRLLGDSPLPNGCEIELVGNLLTTGRHLRRFQATR
jgi:uncharacterized protein (TIGR02996 family)